MPKYQPRSNFKNSPAYIDTMDETRTIVPFGTVRNNRQRARVYFEAGNGQPEYAGVTVIPVKMLDDRTVEQHKLTHSQHVGFLLKVDEKK